MQTSCIVDVKLIVGRNALNNTFSALEAMQFAGYVHVIKSDVLSIKN